ncbi:hypothetical protein KY348_01745 [Candidatus Woesearchaeota archaeon]|nr:hypothetical protein [Candidatus Woesearchaeota archaeon]
METVEIVVYITIVLIIGVLIFIFIRTAGFEETYDDIRGEKPEEGIYQKVDKVGFVSELISFWQNCGLGDIDKTMTVYVKDEGDLDKAFVFSTIKKINHCNTLQSVSEDCGSKEQVVFNTPITLPHVIRLECDSSSEELIITG